MFELHRASYAYAETLALKPFTRTFKPGRIIVLVGPNGAGKSTLLNLLIGELAPSSGDVCLQARTLQTWKAHELAQKRAVLPQRTHLSFPFTVHEVAGLGLMSAAMGQRERRHLISEMLAQVDLATFRNRLYQQLSGGEQQRVQLARVLCQLEASNAPATERYLLLDEPVSSLDIRHQISTMEIARRYAMQGLGVIAVLHDLNLAAHYADEVIVLSHGAVIADGPPDLAFVPEIIEQAFGVRPELIGRGAGRTPLISIFNTDQRKTTQVQQRALSQDGSQSRLVH